MIPSRKLNCVCLFACLFFKSVHVGFVSGTRREILLWGQKVKTLNDWTVEMSVTILSEGHSNILPCLKILFVIVLK